MNEMILYIISSIKNISILLIAKSLFFAHSSQSILQLFMLMLARFNFSFPCWAPRVRGIYSSNLFILLSNTLLCYVMSKKYLI